MRPCFFVSGIPGSLTRIKSVPRFARLTFLCGQESKQRRPPCRPVGSASRNRFAIRSGISGRHIPVPSGNVAHRARRPSGIRPSCLPDLNGTWKAVAKSKSLSCALDSGQPKSRSAGGKVQGVPECCRTACRGRGGPYNPSMKTFTSGG